MQNAIENEKLHGDSLTVNQQTYKQQTSDKNAQKLMELQSKNILKTMLKIALPQLISNIAFSCCGFVVHALYGRFAGEMLFTAISVFTPTENLFFMNPMISSAQGASVLLSQALGQGDFQSATLIQSQYILISFSIGFLISLLFGFNLKKYFIIIGMTESVAEEALKFGQLIVWLAPLIYPVTGIEQLLVCYNKSVLMMLFQIAEAIIIVFCIALFVIILQFQARGIAYAFIVSSGIALIIVLQYLCSKHSTLKVTLKSLKPNFEIIAKVIKMGFVCYLQILPQCLRWITSAYFIKKICKTESQTIELQQIFGIVNRVLPLCFLPVISLLSGIQALYSYNCGCSNNRRITKILKIAHIIIFGIGIVIVTIVQVFAGVVVKAFSSNKMLYAKSAAFLRISSIGIYLSFFQFLANILLKQDKKLLLIIAVQFLRAAISVALQIILPILTKNPETMFYANFSGDFFAGLTGLLISLYYFRKLRNARQQPLRTQAIQFTENNITNHAPV